MTSLKTVALLLIYAFTVRATGPCEQHHLRWLIDESHLLGSFEPACDPDGSYSSVQCRGSGCYCADPGGRNLGYFTNYGMGAENMVCNCAREKAAFERTRLLGLVFNCNSMGSYGSTQCRGTVCFCADENGEELPESEYVLAWESESLNC